MGWPILISNLARINGAGGHSGCLAVSSRIKPSASSVRPSRIFRKAVSRSFGVGPTGLAGDWPSVTGPARVAEAEHAMRIAMMIGTARRDRVGAECM